MITQPMTVGELIKALEEFDQSLPVRRSYTCIHASEASEVSEDITFLPTLKLLNKGLSVII